MTLELFKRGKFDEFARDELADCDELSLAAYVSMTERLSALDIAKLQDAKAEIEREMAYVLFLAAFGGGLTHGQRELVLAMARAVLVPEAEWRIRIDYSRRGRPLSILELAQAEEKRRQIIESLERDTGKGVKLEAAIAGAMAEHGVSRSTAFKAWSKREGFARSHAFASKVVPAWKAVKTGSGGWSVGRLSASIRRAFIRIWK